MKFIINKKLLVQSRASLFKRKTLYWIVGGAGSGKTTIIQALSKKFAIPVYDMDAQIYGTYHRRFTQKRHPVNKAWSKSENGLAWLLDMSWDEFNNFNQAALPEYLDLLAEDLETIDANASLLVDGGICNPALVAQIMSNRQIVCLAVSKQLSTALWEENEERKAMKKVIYQLPEGEKAWQKFLEFDRRITQTILDECRESDIPVCLRNGKETVERFAERVAQVLEIC